MPRGKKLQSPAVQQRKPTDKLQAKPLVYEERKHLLSLLDDPIFVRAWQNAELMRPPIFTASKEEQYFPQACSHRLHQLQGWEMFKTALISQTEEPKLKPDKPVERFPDAGTLEAEIQSRLHKPALQPLSPHKK